MFLAGTLHIPQDASRGPHERICRYGHSLLLEFVNLSISLRIRERGL